MKKYIKLLTMTATELLTHLDGPLEAAGYEEFVRGRDFLYAPGDLPVLLVAHVDTVQSTPRPEQIFYDRGAGVLWCPNGLGADDRAGVAGILEILQKGYKPHVLFCDGEESGGRGAREAADALPRPDVQFMVELDRRGHEDAVFYRCEAKKFHNYVLSFGFKKAWGSFSDISVLGPAWKICSTNLSIGYYNEHRDTEHWFVKATLDTVNRVCGMLQNIPKKPFKYEEYSYQNWWQGRGQENSRTAYRNYYYNGKWMTYKEWKAALDAEEEEEKEKLTKAEEKTEQITIEAVEEIEDYKDKRAEESPVEISDENTVMMWVEPGDISDMYGGTESDWVDFLQRHKMEIEAHLDGELWSKVDELVYADALNEGKEELA